jgi:sugar lactone lactonase YvrE
MPIVLVALVGTVCAGFVSRAEAFGVRDILVVDADSGRNANGALLHVDPVTGERTILSVFGDDAQGPTGKDPVAVALDASQGIVVIDRRAGTDGRGALFRVDPGTGARTLVSDFGDPTQGVTGSRPAGIAVEPSGDALVIDPSAGRNHRGALFRVDSMTGIRTLLSDFGDAEQGPTGDDPVAIAIEPAGDILVADPSVGDGGLLFRVNAETGARTVLSDLADGIQGPTGTSPAGVAVETSGTILVIDSSAGLAINGALFRVDPINGARTLLSDFGNALQGPTGGSPAHIAIEASGTIVVTDTTAGSGGLVFRVDPSTGMRTIVSDCDSNAKGLVADHPSGIAIVRGSDTP